MTSHCFCHIQFIRIELQSQAHAQAEGTTQGVNAKRQGSMGATSEAPTILLLDSLWAKDAFYIFKWLENNQKQDTVS